MSPIVILFIVIILVVILLVFFFSPKKTSNEIGPTNVTDLSRLTSITDTSDILNSNQFSLSFFVQLTQHKEVVQTISDSTRYPIVEFTNAWSIDFIGLPDASRQNKSYIQFTYKISGGAITNQLPPIPFQQWTYITILCDSRRIDICYNGQVVFSKIYSANRITGATLTFGNTNIYGKFTTVTLNSLLQSIEDIKNQYNSFSDTNGQPSTAALIRFPTFSDIVSTNYLPTLPVLQTGAPNPGMMFRMAYA